MKKRKLITALVSMSMLLSMNMTAVAATISGPSATTYQNHTYDVYQIFTGDYADGTLSNLKWGENNTQYQTEQVTKQICNQCGAQFDTAREAGLHTLASDGCENYRSEVVDIPASVPSNVTDALTAVYSASDKEKLEVIEPYVNFESDPYGTVKAGGSLTDVPDGYYLIKDNITAGYQHVYDYICSNCSYECYTVEDMNEHIKENIKTGCSNYSNSPCKHSSNGDNDSYSLYVVNVIGEDLTITPKSDVPTFEKKLKDMDDTTNTMTSWQDGADWDIGDTIPFQLKGTVADNYTDYDSYTFVFHDHESAGLDFEPESVVVKVDDATISTGYDVVTEALSDGCTFEIRFDDLKDIEQVHAGSVITAEYNATLNEDAVIGSEGNLNKAKLEFSNNPNTGNEESTSETPWDTVIVFTYKTVINKINSESKPLAGAAFKLEKNMNGTWTTVKEFTADGSTTSFSFEGLDDGSYRLTETETPKGYNSIDPIGFTVTAEHSITADTPELTSLNGNVTTGELTLTSDKDAGSLTASVMNQRGPELPETGGIGTRIFYVVGVVLMAGAAIGFVVRKRAEK